jgi:methylated-DNA-protein-cysteine methyltransferase-like protein
MPLEKDFFLRVFDIVRAIPEGKVTTYGHIAKALGMTRGARMVGWAMNASHSHDSTIPAHRVVNRLGMLSGKMHFETPDIMREKLESEGLNIVEDKIVDFPKHLWDPMTLAEDM